MQILGKFSLSGTARSAWNYADNYLEHGNIREMHQLSAVGTADEASIDDRGLYIGAKVVDDVAWGKVTSGVY